MRRRALTLGFALAAAIAVSGCVSSVGVSYGYNDSLYWNHYYYGPDRDVDIDVDIDRPDRPPINRPDRPVQPPTTLPGRPRPPVAKPLPARPPIHKPSRPGGGGGRFR
ncbi:MAG: hypothetical protein AAGB05_09470 [Pseudomonadota bacterium]